ncbi:MAG: flagella basal body P-ring formation protein FlgA [Chloroflexi bacterium]|nr:flagella basal body P-ring formation protein FlgA [Chloroflexota bacterium]
MGRKRGGTMLMAFGVVLALLAGGIVFFIASTATAPAAPIPTKEVVVARADISERTIITETQVQVVKMPEEVIPPGAVLKLEEVVGKFAKEKIRARTPVLGNHLATTGKPGEVPPTTQPAPAAAAGPGIGGAKPAPAKLVDAAFTLDRGRVMVAVDYPEAAKLVSAGILRPGDKVDIYVKTAGVAGDQIALIFSNMEIKAIGDLSQTEEAKAASSTLIFVVTPQEAVVLKFLENLNPFFLLRAAGDEQVLRTDLVTMDYIVARFGLQRPVGGR